MTEEKKTYETKKDPIEEMTSLFHFQCDQNDKMKKQIENLQRIISEKDAVIAGLSVSLEKITAMRGGQV